MQRNATVFWRETHLLGVHFNIISKSLSTLSNEFLEFFPPRLDFESSKKFKSVSKCYRLTNKILSEKIFAVVTPITVTSLNFKLANYIALLWFTWFGLLKIEIDGPRQSAVDQSEVPVQTVRPSFFTQFWGRTDRQTRHRLVLLVCID